MHNPVLCVSAPLGYGKSTSVRHYLEEYGSDSIWVSALHDDDRKVWKNICCAIIAKRGEAGRKLRSIGFPAARYFIPQIIEAFKLVAREPLAIVIDDCHLLAEDSLIYHTIYALAMEHIEGLRIICVTRSVPSWLLTEMRAKELCAVISADTLAFTEDDVLAYLRQRKVLPPTLIAGEAKKIRDVSEGWIAAVVLLAEGLRQGRHVTALESTHDLFEHTLFQRLSEDKRLLLIKLSVLDEFTLPQAEFVLETPEVLHIIAHLHEQDAFIMYNIDSNSYKMHTLLRGFLAHKATVGKVDLNPVLLNLARWEYAHNQHGAALKHYHQSNNIIEFFERISEEEYIRPALDIRDDYFETFKEFPPEMALRFPRIYIYMALCFMASGDIERERFALKCIGMLRRHFVYGNTPHPQRERIICELFIVLHLSQFNDPYKVMDLHKCVNGEVLHKTLAPIASTISLSACLPSLLYCFYRKPGELDAMIAFAEANFDCDRLAGLGYGFEKLLHAEKHFERAEMDKARFYARQAIQKGWLREQMYIIASAHFVLARIAMLEGDSGEVTAQLDIIKFEIPRKLTAALTQDAAHSYSLMTLLCETLMHSLMCNARQLASSIPDMHTFGQSYPYQGLGIPNFFRIKYHIIIGEFAEAEVLCDYYDKEFTRYPSQLGRIRSKLYRSVINMHLYGIDAAVSCLNIALEEAALDDVVAPFAENVELLLPVLEAVVPSERLPESYLSKVRAFCLRSGDTIRLLKKPAGVGLLTRRETEVFHLLAKGLSQKNIATRLCISVTTVKQHLLKIYAKLGVNNRVAALNKWLTMGFE